MVDVARLRGVTVGATEFPRRFTDAELDSLVLFLQTQAPTSQINVMGVKVTQFLAARALYAYVTVMLAMYRFSPLTFELPDAFEGVVGGGGGTQLAADAISANGSLTSVNGTAMSSSGDGEHPWAWCLAE